MDCTFAIIRRMLRGRSPFSPDMDHFHHRLMAKGLSHGKAVLAMWAAAFTCSGVAVAAGLGKGDQLTALLVFFGLGGFILLRYLGYFRLEFFGQGFSSLMEDRKSTRSAEQAVKDAEEMLGQMNSLEGVSEVIGLAIGEIPSIDSIFHDKFLVPGVKASLLGILPRKTFAGSRTV